MECYNKRKSAEHFQPSQPFSFFLHDRSLLITCNFWFRWSTEPPQSTAVKPTLASVPLTRPASHSTLPIITSPSQPHLPCTAVLCHHKPAVTNKETEFSRANVTYADDVISRWERCLCVCQTRYHAVQVIRASKPLTLVMWPGSPLSARVLLISMSHFHVLWRI